MGYAAGTPLHFVIRRGAAAALACGASHPTEPWPVRSPLLRIHRLLALAFAAPLLLVVATGLVIAFEPILAALPAPGGRLTAEAFEPALRRADPDGRAMALFVDAHAGAFSLGGRGGARFAIATGEKLPEDGEGIGLMRTARGLHQTLLLDDLGEAVVIASTAALIALLIIGLVMGLPRRLRFSMLGWHKALGWFLAPLLILSPATGLMLAFGWFAPPRAARVPSPPNLVEAVRIVGARHDLNDVVWIRRRGANLIARVRDGGEWRGFIVGREGLTPQPRNWPRLLHEGNWGGALSGGLNVIVSLALLGLLGTGGVIWWRRRLVRRDAEARRRSAVTAAAPG